MARRGGVCDWCDLVKEAVFLCRCGRFILLTTMKTLALFLSSFTIATSSLSAKPNVIYLMDDELGYFEPAFMGGTNIQTPNLDRMAAEGVRFIEVFIRRGIAPDGGGAYLLPRLIGVQKAKELMFFGDDLHAEDALAMGLVNRVVPADELMDAARALADRLAGQPTKVLSLTKMMVNRSLESDRLTMFEFEAMSQDLLLRGEDAQEGVAAFKERRTPSWKGW